MNKITITKEEQKAISSLKRLAKKWPYTLSLFSQSGCLLILKSDGTGQECDIGHVPEIRNDGGDADEEIIQNQDVDIDYE